MAKITVGFEQPRQDGKRKVVFNLSHRGARKRIPVDIELSPQELTKDSKGNIKVKSEQKRFEISQELAGYEKKLHNMRKEYVGLQITVDEIYSFITKKDRPQEVDFFSFAESWLKSSDIKGKKNYETMLNSLERHIGIRYLPFSKIDYTFLSEYSASLKDRPRAQSLYLGAIRHIHKQAQLTFNTDTKIVISPMLFVRFKVPKQQMKGQRAITLEHLQRIIKYHGKGRAMLARDCFVLSFLLMGMNSADMYDTDAKLTDGHICYHRKKTRERRSDRSYMEVAVLPQAKAIIDKYRGKKSLFNFSERYADEAQFNRAINIGLNTVESDINAEASEKKEKDFQPIENLQFYQARHTWASIARNDIGIDKSTVNDALCHVDKEMRVTDLYIKKDFTLINDANKKVVDFVFTGKSGTK